MKDISMELTMVLVFVTGITLGYFYSERINKALVKLDGPSAGVISNTSHPAPSADDKGAVLILRSLAISSTGTFKEWESSEFYKAQWENCLNSIDEKTMCLK